MLASAFVPTVNVFTTFFVVSSIHSIFLPLFAFRVAGNIDTVIFAEVAVTFSQRAVAPLTSDFFFELPHVGFVLMSFAMLGSFHFEITPPKIPLIVAGLSESVAPLSSSRRYPMAIAPATYGT